MEQSCWTALVQALVQEWTEQMEPSEALVAHLQEQLRQEQPVADSNYPANPIGQWDALLAAEN